MKDSISSIMMNVVVLAACVAMTFAFQPGKTDLCNGTGLIPHEKYCQLYYVCPNKDAVACPGSQLFAHGTGIATCVGQGFSTYSCPKWSCQSPSDLGSRYPDICCGKYWQCTAVNTFTQKVCEPGTSFDTASELCTQYACDDSEFCMDNKNRDARECDKSVHEDPCMYRTHGQYDGGAHKCPPGSAFNVSSCSCNQLDLGCSDNPANAVVFKSQDDQCRASGRIIWAQENGGLYVRNDILGQTVAHYIHTSPGFTTESGEGVFDNSYNVIPFIYDFHYIKNELYAPFAIVMTVRFDFKNIKVNDVYDLLENRWSTEPGNKHCEVTLRIAARYVGIHLGDRQWTFTITAKGDNYAADTAEATITGNEKDYYRIVFTYGTKTIKSGKPIVGMGGVVVNRGQTGEITGKRVKFTTGQINLGTYLMPNKCGFAIGRGLGGRIREFAVHEGCGSLKVVRNA